MNAKTIAQLRENIEQGIYLPQKDERYTRLVELYNLPFDTLCLQHIALEKENAQLRDQLAYLREKYDYEKSGASDSDYLEMNSDVLEDADNAIPQRIESLPPELQSYIVNKAAFGQIVRVLNKKILPYIREKENQSLWDVVRFVFQYKEFVKKKLSRIKFATLLVTLCPDAGEAKKIKQNMEQCTLTAGRRKPEDFDELPEDHELKQAGLEILKLLG